MTGTNHKQLLNIIEPLIYADIFDYPLSLTEIHRNCAEPITKDDLRHIVDHDPLIRKVISSAQGYYFLIGRDELVTVRQRRQVTSSECWARARQVAKCLQYVPFVRGLLVTGSLAVDNATEHDDLDFLVLTSPGRLWFVFAILGTAQRLVSRFYLCPNYYLSIDHLLIRRRTPYVAREALQARFIAGFDTCQQFHDVNDWVYQYFPNWNGSFKREVEPEIKPFKILKRIHSLLEWLLNGRVGNILERLFKTVLKHRLITHYGLYGQKVPSEIMHNALNEVELRFHGLRHEERIFEQFSDRIKQVQEQLG
ncbi:hypothetical protein JXQ70_08190 [bacterium]|nr:hypothetical protein [bacterium]